MEEGENEESNMPAKPAGGLEAVGQTDPTDGLVHPPPGSIPVVGLGGSAGSLSALSSFVSEIPPDSGDAPEAPLSEQSLVQHLEEELDQMRSTWRDMVEEHESSVEELKAKVEELGHSKSDPENLMSSTNIATIFLDHELRIKLFTPSSKELFSFIPSDQGRPLSELNIKLDYPAIREDAMSVLENLTMIEREMKDKQGKWFLVRMSPYQTSDDIILDNKTTGVVITCIDITERKKNEESHRWLSAIVESSADAIISFNLEGNVISWNKGAEWIFGYTPEEIIGKSQAILAPESLQDEKKEILSKLQQGKIIEPFETVRICKDGKKIDVSISASVIRDDSGEIMGATAIARDISKRKQALENLKYARDNLEQKVNERTVELRARIREIAHIASELTLTENRERKRMARILHDELQQLLVSAKMSIQSLDGLNDDERKQETKNLTKLMDELIQNSRTLSIDLSPPVLSETLGQALEWLCLTWMPEKHNLSIKTNIDLSLDAQTEEIRSTVFYSVRELLFNVVKHSEVLEAHVELVPHGDGDLKVTVRDHGLGFDTEAPTLKDGKATGFGLIGLKERLDMLGGDFILRSQPNDGVEAVIIAPRQSNNDK